MSRAACGFHSLVHGCAYGPRPRTMQLIAIREGVATSVREADATIVFSGYVSGLAERNGVAAHRTMLLTPPLEDASYANEPADRPANDSILFAGRVMPSKGARSLVHALAKIEITQRPFLRIAGDGPDLGSVVDEAFELGVAMKYLGHLRGDALRAAYDDSTLVAMPSTWAEPFGLVGIEAFARGRPVVAYDSGGIAQWLSPDAGRLVARGDEDALASAISSLLGPAAWRDASAHAFAAAQGYRLHSHILRLRQIYAGG